MPKRINLVKRDDWMEWLEKRSMPEPNTGCLLWTASLSDQNRPHAAVGGRIGNAFRLLWEGVNGPIPDGLYLCHRCDNPACVNLDHGFLGTPGDNARDCAKKGRQWLQSRSGFDNPNAKITPELLVWLKANYRPRHPIYGARALSRRLHIGRNMLMAAINGRSFKNFDRAILAAESNNPTGAA